VQLEVMRRANRQLGYSKVVHVHQARQSDWSPIGGNHHGQASESLHKKAGHMSAIASVYHPSKSACQAGPSSSICELYPQSHAWVFYQARDVSRNGKNFR
jgi:hypothetical protein